MIDPFRKTLLMSLLSGMLMSAPVTAADNPAEVDDAVNEAAAALAEADKMGMLWSVWDEAGDQADSTDLDTLLNIAREKQASGDRTEALRLAHKVRDMANEGIEQGRAAANMTRN